MMPGTFPGILPEPLPRDVPDAFGRAHQASPASARQA
jgi:hypothetical protein